MKLRLPISLAFAAICALLLGSSAPAGADSPWRAQGAGDLTDLQVGTDQPTDHATAQVFATESGGTTTVTLKVQGIDHAAVGARLGAHVHTGACIDGKHYNSTDYTVISDQTEVWLDFTVDANGTGSATATVPFLIPDGGATCVVIHAGPTNPATGAAGSRWGCVLVDF